MATVKKPNVNDYTGQKYTSQYESQINDALNKVTNRQEFTYDPLKDASYQALAKIYTKRGNQARQNVMGDASALTGGYASSYATSAAAQAQSDYNQQLAAQIPALQQVAYDKYTNEFNMNMNSLNALRDADNSAYGKFRDSVADSWNKYNALYGEYRDNVADTQWKTEFDRNKYESDRAYNRDKYESDRAYKRDVYESDRNYKYQTNRDKVTDSQWQKEYNLKKNNLGRSSGSSRSGYNYVGSSGGSSSSRSSNPYYKQAKKNADISNTVMKNTLKAVQGVVNLAKKQKKK